jgi:hypothetical protein
MFSLSRRRLTAVCASRSGCLVVQRSRCPWQDPCQEPPSRQATQVTRPGRCPRRRRPAGGEAGGDAGSEAGVDGGEPLAPIAGAWLRRSPPAPEDYGQIKPPVPCPPPEALTVHAMAGYEVVTVYSQPTSRGQARLHADRYADDGEREGRGRGLQERVLWAAGGWLRVREQGAGGRPREGGAVEVPAAGAAARSPCRTTTGSCAGGTARCGGASPRTRSCRRWCVQRAEREKSGWRGG